MRGYCSDSKGARRFVSFGALDKSWLDAELDAERGWSSSEMQVEALTAVVRRFSLVGVVAVRPLQAPKSSGTAGEALSLGRKK